MSFTPQSAVALYVGLNLILMLVLALRVSLVRRATQTSLGDGGNETLLARMRAHANLIEYAPPVLLGLWVAAALGMPVLAIHAIGGGFTVARVLHAIGMALGGGNVFRILGSLGSLLALLVVGAALIGHALV